MYLKDEKPTQYTCLTGGEYNNANLEEGKKNFIFSSTGNIMVATTEADSSNMDESVRKVFNEVSVFFAAMSKAISTTKRPGTNEYYSIYNYEALAKLIGGSGCFVHCTQEDIKYTSSSFGAQFSRELLSALLALPIGGGSLAFAQAMISSIGQEGLKLSGSSDTSNSKVGNIVFVCEFLFGIPIVSAIVVYTDSKSQKTTFQAGPCVKTTSTKVELTMHKDVYMFVTPSFIKEYASDLDSIISSSEYNTFISYLQSMLSNTVWVDGIYLDNQKIKDSTLKLGQEYRIVGQNFGHTQGKLTFGNEELSAAESSWSNTEIKFSISEPSEKFKPLKMIISNNEGESLEENLGNYKVIANDTVQDHSLQPESNMPDETTSDKNNGKELKNKK